MLCDIKNPYKTFATLDLKAAETKHFLHACIPVAKELLTMDLVEEKAMLQALDAISRIIKLYDDADAFLTEAEWLKVMGLSEKFQDRYAYLSSWALEEGRKKINIVMKSHTFQHLVENSNFLNPKTHWTFSSEDFVGKISIVASSVSPGVSSTKISAKLAPKYRVLLLHFLLTREGMDMAARNIDPWERTMSSLSTTHPKITLKKVAKAQSWKRYLLKKNWILSAIPASWKR